MRSLKRLLIGSALCVIGTACLSFGKPPTGQTASPTALRCGEKKMTNADDLKKRLTPLQFEVTQNCGTEPPFRNAYWNEKRDGIYVDVVSGEALFSSKAKFDSGTGWPSFTKPLEETSIHQSIDESLAYEKRIEVRSSKADSHLGHVFDDGPKPTGKRYCINSASLRFIPVEDLEKEGYGQFLPLFGKKAAGGLKRETAVLAGGCFWGMEEIIRQIPGVLETDVGYTGGALDHAKYTDVKTGRTGHAEAVRVVFDPAKLSYEDLLAWFFRMHDPTTLNRQGNDIGTQYRSAIFFTSEQQKASAEKVKARVDASGKWKKPIVTEIVKAGEFWPAEDYHQKYLIKNPGGYTCHFLRD